MYDNKDFHCDLKIDNIGFTKDCNIILIDYCYHISRNKKSFNFLTKITHIHKKGVGKVASLFVFIY